jgi:hypothetical protein
MESEIGNPIEYNPLSHEKEQEHEHEHDQSQMQQQPYYMDYPPPPPPQETEKFDLFAKVEKSTWIIAFGVFLLGFFMGKTMQPVILRYT